MKGRRLLLDSLCNVKACAEGSVLAFVRIGRISFPVKRNFAPRRERLTLLLEIRHRVCGPFKSTRARALPFAAKRNYGAANSFALRVSRMHVTNLRMYAAV